MTNAKKSAPEEVEEAHKSHLDGNRAPWVERILAAAYIGERKLREEAEAKLADAVQLANTHYDGKVRCRDRLAQEKAQSAAHQAEAANMREAYITLLNHVEEARLRLGHKTLKAAERADDILHMASTPIPDPLKSTPPAAFSGEREAIKDAVARAMFDAEVIEREMERSKYSPHLIPGYTSASCLDTAWAADGKTRGIWLDRASRAIKAMDALRAGPGKP